MPTIDLGYVVGPQGPQGVAGQTGAQGIQGNPGPNQVTGSTSTTLNGILQGNGSVVQAVASDNAPVSDSNNIVRSGKLFTEFAKHARPNLLDNWYFVGGGGSNGVFPVAQKAWGGETSHTGTGYFIDRWYSYASGQVVTLQSGGITLYNADSPAYFQQYLEPFAVPIPTTFTFSVLYSANGSCRLYDNLTGSTRNSAWQDLQGEIGLLTLTTTVGSGTLGSSPHVWFSSYNGVTATIYAAKLEVGNTSTLASLDSNGNWILCDIPNYADELSKCQRHMILINPERSTNISFGFGSGYGASSIYPVVPLPTTLRSNPSVSFTGTPTVQSGSTRIDVSAISHYRRLTNGEAVQVTSSGLTVGAFYSFGFGSNPGTLTFDSNIYP